VLAASVNLKTSFGRLPRHPPVPPTSDPLSFEGRVSTIRPAIRNLVAPSTAGRRFGAVDPVIAIPRLAGGFSARGRLAPRTTSTTYLAANKHSQ
jgi:hypothetical protein